MGWEISQGEVQEGLLLSHSRGSPMSQHWQGPQELGAGVGWGGQFPRQKEPGGSGTGASPTATPVLCWAPGDIHRTLGVGVGLTTGPGSSNPLSWPDPTEECSGCLPSLCCSKKE